MSENFLQFFIRKEKVELKVDMVNDVAPHYSDLIYDERFGKVNSLRNILSNKFLAVFSYEAKNKKAGTVRLQYMKSSILFLLINWI